MALSHAASIARIRDLVAEVTGMQRVYAPSETNDDKIPEALDKFPAAVVLNGPITEYILGEGQHRKTYTVRVQLFSGNGDDGDRSAAILPYVDLILEKFVANVTLGGRVNSCVFESDSGLIGLEYPPGTGLFYVGEELIFRVSEQAAASPAPGA